MIFTVSAEDLIEFAESGGSHTRPGTIEDVIVFRDYVLCNINFTSAADVFVFNDYALVNFTRAFSFADTLVFKDTVVPRSTLAIANDFLFMYDVLDHPKAGSISDLFVLADNAVMTLSKLMGPDVLAFVEVISPLYIPGRALSEFLTLSDRFSYVLVNKDTPDIPVGHTPPTLNLKCYIQDATELLELDNFDFNDSETTRYKRVNRTSRGYTTIINSVVGWPPFRSKKVTFTYLCEKDANKIRAFARRNVGNRVIFTDMYGRAIYVIIQNPEFETAQLGRENRSITLDFYVL